MSALDDKVNESMRALIWLACLLFENPQFLLGKLPLGGKFIEPSLDLLAILPGKVVGAFKRECEPLCQKLSFDRQIHQCGFPEKRDVVREKNSARRGLARGAPGFAINRAQYRPFKEFLNPRRTVSFIKLLFPCLELPARRR